MTANVPRARILAERLAASQYGVIGRAEAGLCGLTPRMIQYATRAGGPWQRLLPGVYALHTGAPDRDQRLMGALLYAGDGALITGLAALNRYAFRMPGTQAVDVLVPHARRRVSRDFVVIHRTRSVPPMFRADGPIRYAPPARAVADAAAGLRRLGDLRAVAASAVQQGLCTVSELAAEAGRGHDRAADRLRAVLAEVADGIRSPAEGDFRDLVLGSGLPVPMLNARLYLGRRLLAIPDAWWPQAGVAAEVDSQEWHSSPAGFEDTMRRHARMTAAGVLVLHFSPRQVRTAPGEVVAAVGAALQAGRPIPGITTRPVGDGTVILRRP
jgi:hypothetical protein